MLKLLIIYANWRARRPFKGRVCFELHRCIRVKAMQCITYIPFRTPARFGRVVLTKNKSTNHNVAI